MTQMSVVTKFIIMASMTAAQMLSFMAPMPAAQIPNSVQIAYCHIILRQKTIARGKAFTSSFSRHKIVAFKTPSKSLANEKDLDLYQLIVELVAKPVVIKIIVESSASISKPPSFLQNSTLVCEGDGQNEKGTYDVSNIMANKRAINATSMRLSKTTSLAAASTSSVVALSLILSVLDKPSASEGDLDRHQLIVGSCATLADTENIIGLSCVTAASISGTTSGFVSQLIVMSPGIVGTANDIASSAGFPSELIVMSIHHLFKLIVSDLLRAPSQLIVTST